MNPLVDEICGMEGWRGLKGKLGSDNLTYVIIHMPSENFMQGEKRNLPQFCEWLICRVKWGLTGATLYRENLHL